jgi:hypothetical protein
MEHDHYVDAIVTIAYLLSITPRFRKKVKWSEFPAVGDNSSGRGDN